MNLPENRKKINRLFAKAKFNNETVSSNVTFTYIEAFKNIIGFSDLIKDTITYK